MMEQQYDSYTQEDFEVWKILFSRQKNNLKDKACKWYLDCLEKLSPVLNDEFIPNIDSLSEHVESISGWSLVVVPGLIPVDEFFAFLSNKQFCSSTWLRKKSQLDYLEEPDMFHDIFGHIPLLLIPKYAEYMEEIGKLGVKYRDNEKMVIALQRLYWFTIEFGLVTEDSKDLIYGAGIVSSFGESNHVIQDTVEWLPFNLKDIFNREFINSEIQTCYFRVNCWNDLFDSLPQIENTILALQ